MINFSSLYPKLRRPEITCAAVQVQFNGPICYQHTLLSTLGHIPYLLVTCNLFLQIPRQKNDHNKPSSNTLPEIRPNILQQSTAWLIVHSLPVTISPVVPHVLSILKSFKHSHRKCITPRTVSKDRMSIATCFIKPPHDS